MWCELLFCRKSVKWVQQCSRAASCSKKSRYFVHVSLATVFGEERRTGWPVNSSKPLQIGSACYIGHTELPGEMCALWPGKCPRFVMDMSAKVAKHRFACRILCRLLATWWQLVVVRSMPDGISDGNVGPRSSVVRVLAPRSSWTSCCRKQALCAGAAFLCSEKHNTSPTAEKTSCIHATF